MRLFSAGLTFSAAALLSLGVAFSQDASMQGHDMGATVELPAVCRSVEAPGISDMGSMQSMMGDMREHQRAFMRSMMTTQDSMMQGMMAEDPDVAFACAMIPHHLGAIGMAETELDTSKNPDLGPSG
jgi:uncharacterized protein (DUF305 family)